MNRQVNGHPSRRAAMRYHATYSLYNSGGDDVSLSLVSGRASDSDKISHQAPLAHFPPFPAERAITEFLPAPSLNPRNRERIA